MRCSVFIAASLDGFIARTDGGIDWLSLVQTPGEDYGYARFFASIDTVVLGRKTYETALGFDAWPYAGKRCIVLTHAHVAAKNDAELEASTPADLVARLEGDGARHAYVDGGAVIRQFLAAGLVTDMTLSIVPILLGKGIALFGDLGRDVRLQLVESRSFASGLVQLRYAVGNRHPA